MRLYYAQQVAGQGKTPLPTVPAKAAEPAQPQTGDAKLTVLPPKITSLPPPPPPAPSTTDDEVAQQLSAMEDDVQAKVVSSVDKLIAEYKTKEAPRIIAVRARALCPPSDDCGIIY